MNIASKNIRVPSPCSQNWNKMPEQDHGRFCNHCAHVVTDFTHMSDEAVVQFLIQHRNEKICGQFRKDQLSKLRITVTPAQLQSVNWTVLQQVRIAIFLVFASTLFSCSSIEPRQQAPEIILQNIDTLSDQPADAEVVNDSLLKSGRIEKKKSVTQKPPELSEQINHLEPSYETVSGLPVMDYPESEDEIAVPPPPDSIQPKD